MKTEKEIEQLAEQDFNNRQECGHYELADLKSRDYYYDGFTNGYTQCQEDMAKDVEYWQGEFDHWYKQAMDMAEKRYTEEDMLKAFEYGKTIEPFDCFEDFINSLNKQD